MTANQIAYAKHREEARHNRVSEAHEHRDVSSREQTAAANYWQAATASARATEEARHNKAVENQTAWFNRAQIGEQERANREKEQISWYSATSEDAYRRSTATSQMRQASVAERNATTQWMQLGNEEMKARASLLQAQASHRQAKVREDELSETIAQNARYLGLQYSQLAEAQRHNLASEGITSSYNAGTLAESFRHNVESEKVAQSQAISASRQAAAASQNAYTASRNASVNERGATSREEEVEVAKRNATSNRINAVANAVRSGSQAIGSLSALARSIVR